MPQLSKGADNPNMIIGVFATLRGAEAAVGQLESLGLSSTDITVISSSEVVKKYFAEYRPDSEPSDWKGAAAAGGSAGAILAGLTSVTALATGAGIPVVIAGGLASLLTGGVIGGLAGVMTQRGFETEAADYFELAVADGKTLVAVDLANHQGAELVRPQVDQALVDAGAEPLELHKNPDFSS